MRDIRRLGLMILFCPLLLATMGALPYVSVAAVNGLCVNPPEGTMGCATMYLMIGDAVAMAAPGDTITVYPGTYTENLFLNRDLILAGVGAVIVNGGERGSVLVVNSGVTTRVSGIMLTNGGGYLPQADALGMVGGGIYNLGTLTVTNCTVANNHVSGSSGGNGGGIYNTGTLTIVNTTVSGNAALGTMGSGQGGGLYNMSGLVTVVNSTIVGNSAAGGGGAIANSAGMALINSTITGNTAMIGTGGIALLDSGQGMTMDGTVVVLNRGSINRDIAPTIIIGSYNVVGGEGNSVMIRGNSNSVNGGDSGLANDGILVTNGGPTQTVAVLPLGLTTMRAPTTCATDPSTGKPLSTDQRGVIRPQGGHCTIGAVQLMP